MHTVRSIGVRGTGAVLRRPAPLALLREYLEYRRVRRQLLALPASLRGDIGVTRDEIEQAAASFAAWRLSRFGRARQAASTMLLAALLG